MPRRGAFVVLVALVASALAACPSFQAAFPSPYFVATPDCSDPAHNPCQPGPGNQCSTSEVGYSNNVLFLGLDPQAGTAGEVTSTCTVGWGTVTLSMVSNIAGGAGVGGTVTDVSIDWDQVGAVNLQLFGSDGYASAFSAYGGNGGNCADNSRLPSDSTQGWHMYTITYNAGGAKVAQDNQVYAQIGNCLPDLGNSPANIKVHIWGCNGNIAECNGASVAGAAGTWVQWLNYASADERYPSFNLTFPVPPSLEKLRRPQRA